MRTRCLLRGLVSAVLTLMLLALTATTASAQDVSPEDTEVVVSSIERDPSSGEVTAQVSLPVAAVATALDTEAVSVVVGDVRQDITMTQVTNDGLEVVVVIDVSGSMNGSAIAAAQEAAASFISSIPSTVDIGVVTFADTAQVVSPLQSGGDAAIEAISELTVGGETAFFLSLIHI